ncbi:NAC domain-containing protein 35-like [Salvia miltiorrhiza]|uniref:NAC domain-containing protein 35-like n=1 Tax=Salvia miltiorrhiza TaxID=226208 RepID=UPI0025ACE79A|nr:NAC domain-containing protein 35-like [Salvia miltiorrhiza]
MAIAAAMNNQESKQDEHENDVVMPGFRFHPTEEELVEFYLRRKVEGKRFNVELITFLDLYRYDPWELPALAAIGEKEWYFYVPRDRKYRNGDRPNRVTTSGYWKATGADRMIRSENLRSIGLKKTLVFYSGKAPKGIRTSWIMNEYRLPHHDTERLQKAEISLCRVYKRAGVEDHPSLPRCLPTKATASSSRGSQQARKQQETSTSSRGLIFQPSYGGSPQQTDGKLSETSPTSSADIGTSLALSHGTSFSINPLAPIVAGEDGHLQQQPKTIFSTAASSSNAIDDLHKFVQNYSSSQQAIGHESHHHYNPPNLVSHFAALQPETQELGAVPASLPAAAAYSDRLWEWSGISEAGKDYSNLFK